MKNSAKPYIIVYYTWSFHQIQLIFYFILFYFICPLEVNYSDLMHGNQFNLLSEKDINFGVHVGSISERKLGSCNSSMAKQTFPEIWMKTVLFRKGLLLMELGITVSKGRGCSIQYLFLSFPLYLCHKTRTVFFQMLVQMFYFLKAVVNTSVKTFLSSLSFP